MSRLRYQRLHKTLFMVSSSGYVDIRINKIQNTKHAASRLGNVACNCVLYSNLRLFFFRSQGLTVESKGRCAVSRIHNPCLIKSPSRPSGRLGLGWSLLSIAALTASHPLLKLENKTCFLTTVLEAGMSAHHIQGPALPGSSDSSLPRTGTGVPCDYFFLPSFRIPKHNLIYWENSGDVWTTIRNTDVA